MVDQSVIASIRRYLRVVEEQGIPVSFGVRFGCYATGRADRWSDIDLVVVSPRFDDQIPREEINTLWELAARVDVRIGPIPCGERQWEEDTLRAIVEIARREGQRVDVAEAAEPPAA